MENEKIKACTKAQLCPARMCYGDMPGGCDKWDERGCHQLRTHQLMQDLMRKETLIKPKLLKLKVI